MTQQASKSISRVAGNMNMNLLEWMLLTIYNTHIHTKPGAGNYKFSAFMKYRHYLISFKD